MAYQIIKSITACADALVLGSMIMQTVKDKKNAYIYIIMIVAMCVNIYALFK